MPVKEGDESVPTYTVPIVNENPLWLYCANGRHCQGGMVMVVNENTSKNATRSLENYISAAAVAPANIAPEGGPVGGEDGEADDTTGDDNTNEDPYGGGNNDDASPTDDGADATGTEDETPISTGAAGRLGAGLWAGVLAVGFAMLL